MRHLARLAFGLCIALSTAAQALTPAISPADVIQDRDWQLLAIDGNQLAAEITTTLRFAPEGGVSGQAPCNSFSSENLANLPEISLGPIKATKMACEALAAEVSFFNALSVMQAAVLEGDQTLILTGPDGHSLEFVADRADNPACKTCSD
jgi:heat shock protein HslJ